MWHRFRRLPWHCQGYIALVVVLGGVLGVAWLSLLTAQAAPCPPIGCVPFPTLPGPTGVPPQPFGTPPPNPTPQPTATPKPTASPTPAPTVPPGPAPAPVPTQGQDVGVTALAQAAAGSAGGLSKHINDQLNAPNFGGDWFRPLYNKMSTIGLWVLLFCLLIAVVQYLIHKRFGMVAASWFGWAPGSIAITASGIVVTNLLLAITDALCAYMLAGLNLGGFLEHLAAVLALVAAGTALTGAWIFVAGFIAIALVGIALGIFVELLMRQVVMYVCLLWLPLVSAATAWQRQWLYRLIAFQVAVIFAKFAVVTCIALGVAAVSANPAAFGALGDPNLTVLIWGLIVLLVAFISPLALLKVLPVSFEHAAAGFGQLARKRVMRMASRGGKSLSKRFAVRQAAKGGVQVASKAVGAGAAVVPISLVIGKGGKVIAARGGRVLKQGQAAAQGTPQAQPAQPEQRRQKKGQPAGGRVTPTNTPRSTRRTTPAPGPAARRPVPRLPSPPPPRRGP